MDCFKISFPSQFFCTDTEEEETVKAAIQFAKFMGGKEYKKYREVRENELNARHLLDDDIVVFVVSTTRGPDGKIRRRMFQLAGTNTYYYKNDDGSYSCIDTNLSRRRAQHMDDVYERKEDGDVAVYCVHKSGWTDHGAKCVGVLKNIEEIAMVSGDITVLQRLKMYRKLHKAGCEWFVVPGCIVFILLSNF